MKTRFKSLTRSVQAPTEVKKKKGGGGGGQRSKKL